MVFIPCLSVLVGERTLLDVALHTVQQGRVVGLGIACHVARHFGIELVYAIAEDESLRVECLLCAVLGGVATCRYGALFNDCN